MCCGTVFDVKATRMVFVYHIDAGSAGFRNAHLRSQAVALSDLTHTILKISPPLRRVYPQARCFVGMLCPGIIRDNFQSGFLAISWRSVTSD